MKVLMFVYDFLHSIVSAISFAILLKIIDDTLGNIKNVAPILWLQ